MCPPSYSFSALDALWHHEPAAMSILGGGLVSLVGLGGLLLALRRRHQAMGGAWSALDHGDLPTQAPPPLTKATLAAVALALFMPVLTVAVTMHDRAALRACIESNLVGEPADCTAWGGLGYSVGQHLGWGMVVMVLLLPIAVLVMATLTYLRWRGDYIRALVALATRRGGTSERYRQTACEHDVGALRRLLARRPPGFGIAIALWGAVGLAMVAFGSGVVRSLTTAISGLNGVHLHGNLDARLAESASMLDPHLIVAGAFMGVAFGILVAVRRSTEDWSHPPSWRATAARFALGTGCLVLASPLAAENANPVPASVRHFNAQAAAIARLPITPPNVVGNCDVPYGIQLDMFDRAVELDGQLVGDTMRGDTDELEDMLRRKRELWLSFHPDRAFPGAVNVAVDGRTSVAKLRPWLEAVRRAGYHDAIIISLQTVPFAQAPLGVWASWHRLTGVGVALGCGRAGAKRLDMDGDVEAMARHALEAPCGTACMPTVEP